MSNEIWLNHWETARKVYEGLLKGGDSITLASGKFHLQKESAQATLDQLKALDAQDGAEDGSLKYKEFKRLENTIRLQFAHHEPSALFTSTHNFLKPLFQSKKVIGHYKYGGGIGGISLYGIAILATENNWVETVFKPTLQECISGINCLFLIGSDDHFVMRSKVEKEGGLTVFINVDFSRADLTDLEWRYGIRHEWGHKLLAEIVKKWKAANFFAALRKWARKQDPENDKTFEQFLSGLRDPHNWDRIIYELEEGCDVAFLKHIPSQKLADTDRETLREALRGWLSPANLKKIKNLKNPEQDLYFFRLTRRIQKAKSLGMKEGLEAEATMKNVLSEYAPQLDRMMQLFAWAELFFISEYEWLKRQEEGVKRTV